MTLLLAIDSATQRINLALHDGHEVLAEHSWRSVNRHSAALPPMVGCMLAREEQELTALAVACGPGSFTGLRIGVAFAKGLASARQLPLVGVATPDILAAALPPCPGHALLVLLAAGRGRLIVTRYRRHAGLWRPSGEESLLDLAELLRSVTTPAFIAGELDADCRAALLGAQQDGAPLKLAAPSGSLRRAGFLAEIALKRLRQGPPQDFDPARVTARYVATRDTP